MTKHSLLLAALFLLPLPAQQPVKCSGPLSVDQLLQLVKALHPLRTRAFLDTCGVSFDRSAEAEQRVRAAGAQEPVLEALRAAWAKREGEAKKNEALELEFWREIRESNRAVLFEEYLKRFPDGAFRTMAEERLATLRLRERVPELMARREWAEARAVVQRLLAAAPGDREAESWRKQIEEALNPGPRPAAPLEVNGVRIEFIAIPAGEFLMGCSPGDNECDGDERPPHRVRISKPFEMGKYEVTQAQWEAVMGSNPSRFKGPDRPVEQVSWEDAQQFITRLNARNDGYRYRLPTEAEWEYAARAGSTGKYYDDLNQIAWYGDNSGGQTQPVGRKQPNAWGLHDMLGNVWEWCSDWYGEGYYASSPQADPRGPDSGQSRMLRGGSWLVDPRDLRVSNRFRNTPGNRNNNLGFRLLRERFP